MEGDRDRSWMYNRLTQRRQLTRLFLEGLEEFVQFALAHTTNSSTSISCPCVKCRCLEFHNPGTVRIHLCRKGFMKDYECWKYHGEVQQTPSGYYRDSSNRNNLNQYEQLIMDTAGNLVASDEKLQHKSVQNKLNRSRMDEPSYNGGSIPISQHRRNVEVTGDVPSDMIDCVTFERTNSQESAVSGKCGINAKSLQLTESSEKLSQERATQTATDPASSQSDNENLFIQATRGFDKKGRAFKLGSSANQVKATKRSSNHIGVVSASKHELKRVKTLEQ
ncbi:hypothetical protein QN277_029002 [Acacia crassicarpa]|uniref:Transposase-associated domain-containing protein n=1 Tax=Acacia crassicarpa TaxID=499986 RepID=A0AAE1J632_9FABA|nr:hypothetical protein QN277_029002 [Acacia crassicarpa]